MITKQKVRIFYEVIRVAMGFGIGYLIIILFSVWDVFLSGNNPICGVTACMPVGKFSHSWIGYRLGWSYALVIFIISYLSVIVYTQIINKK